MRKEYKNLSKHSIEFMNISSHITQLFIYSLIASAFVFGDISHSPLSSQEEADSSMIQSAMTNQQADSESLLEPEESQRQFEALLQIFKGPLKINDTPDSQSLIDPSEVLDEAAIRQMMTSQMNEEEVFSSSKTLIDAQEETQNIQEFIKNTLESPSDQLDPAEEIVDETDHLNDFEVRLAVAEGLAQHTESLAEALYHLFILLKAQPHHPLIHLQIGKVYLRQEKFNEANNQFHILMAMEPLQSDILAQLAIAEAQLGHMSLAQMLFEKALEQNRENTPKLLLNYADTMMSWGDFYLAESIYREELNQHPESFDLWLKLASVFSGSERYEEAEQIYLQLLSCYPNHPLLLYALAQLKIIENNFDAALEFANQLPLKDEYLFLKADILFKKGDYPLAIAIYEQMILSKDYSIKSWLKIGRAYLKLEQVDLAFSTFIKIKQVDPFHIEADYYLAKNEVLTDSFLENIIDSASTPQLLEKWASIYLTNGFTWPAIKLYQAALCLDPDYFPSQIGLAQLWAVKFQYHQTIEIYEQILPEYPSNPKLMLDLARAVSWSKQYVPAMHLYDKLIALNPQNPVPIREKARVSFWALQGELGIKIYNQLLVPSVDSYVLSDLQEFYGVHTGEGIDWLDAFLNQDSLYQGSSYKWYEWLQDKIEMHNNEPCTFEIQQILLRYFAIYRIQKSIHLEREIKEFVWRKRYLHARDTFEEFIALHPGSEEALFEYAQNLQIIGVGQQAPSIYYHILHIDPLHSLANIALKRSEILSNPFAIAQYTYWWEKGRGELSNIARQRWSVGLGYFIDHDSRFQLRFLQDFWFERPFFKSKHYPAKGQTLELNHLFSPYFSTFVSFTQKVYSNRKLRTHHLGRVQTWFNLKDYVKLGLSYERAEVLTNYFALIQEIQASSYLVTLQSNLTNKWYIEGNYCYLRYSDHNWLNYAWFSTSYQLTKNPKILKVTIEGEYRNTAHLDRLIYNSTGTKLIDIIHPYWTPQHYYAERFLLEYRYDYSFLQFFEAEQRYFGLQGMIGTGSDRNVACSLSIEWHHDFKNRWTIELTGLIYRSIEWDAEGVWMNLFYRF